MKDVAKKLGFFMLVAAVSAGVSFAVYSYNTKNGVNKDFASTFDGQVPFRGVSMTDVSGVNTDFTVAAEKAVHSVVHIKSTVTVQSRGGGGGRTGDPFFDFFFGDRGGFGQQAPKEREGIGSGVIISNDGYIITNNHVINDADKMEVTLNDNRSFPAKLIGADPLTDIALIKIEAKDLPVISFGDSDKLKIGEWVLAVGNPFNLTSTVTAGIVSAKARSIGMNMGIESFIQTDAAVNPGNSGGALVNTNGELVGINTAIASQTGSFTGYSFAVPISMASKVVSDLKQYGTVQRAVLGVRIETLTSKLIEEKKLETNVKEGVYINSVEDRSSAKEAGIEDGDIITEVNGVKIKSASELQEQVNRYRPGDKVVVKGYRGKTAKTFNISLKNRQGTTAITKDKGIEILGVAFKNISDDLKKQLGISYGLQVAGLQKGKFQDAGIRKDFIILKINDQAIKTEADVESIVSRLLASSEQVMFIAGVYPNGKTGYFAIDLSE